MSNSPISNKSVEHKYTVSISKTVLFRTIQFSISIVFVDAYLNVKSVLFQTIQFSISTQIQCKKNISISYSSVEHKYTFNVKNSSISNYSV